MSKQLRVILVLSVLILLAGFVVYISIFLGEHETALPDEARFSLPTNPLDATYRIEGEEVTLAQGVAEVSAAPGSASVVRTEVVGEPIVLQGMQEGSEVYALTLQQVTGGTGVFYYAALALKDEDGFLGSEAVYLGNRIENIALSPWGELVRVSYVGRATSTSFAEAPDQEVIRYFYVLGASLLEHGPFGPSVRPTAGTLRQDEDGFRFDACAGTRYTIASSSPALGALKAVYAERAQGGSAFMQLALRIEDSEDTVEPVVLEAVLAAPKAMSCADIPSDAITEPSRGGEPVATSSAAATSSQQ